MEIEGSISEIFNECTTHLQLATERASKEDFRSGIYSYDVSTLVSLYASRMALD